METRPSSTFAMRIFFRWFAALGFSLAACAARVLQTLALTPKQTVPVARRNIVRPPTAKSNPILRSLRRSDQQDQSLRDPTFGSRILRVTDARSDPVQSCAPALHTLFRRAEFVEQEFHDVLRDNVRRFVSALRFRPCDHEGAACPRARIWAGGRNHSSASSSPTSSMA